MSNTNISLASYLNYLTKLVLNQKSRTEARNETPNCETKSVTEETSKGKNYEMNTWNFLEVFRFESKILCLCVSALNFS